MPSTSNLDFCSKSAYQHFGDITSPADFIDAGCLVLIYSGNRNDHTIICTAGFESPQRLHGAQANAFIMEEQIQNHRLSWLDAMIVSWGRTSGDKT
eukprot:CAMPEP_0202906494 /NCGR_PEP_ID=MMETSP1392-20130828/39136_1 /ASSEMBLY_ACC=CAM_ASM_000868 /TAXON_ID=225041 /ORGANISM="Chlamydomonas chlamydogama, Strain SAG 11-48b" /LENGTH=95 /DNA_ID=CAMNT_0049595031 /DNA_START=276 /DNA_END=562 /DNA_ORIENTATION=+